MAKSTSVALTTPRQAAVAVQRRQNDRDLRERLVRVEAATDELPAVRQRVHDIAESVHMLVASSEDAEKHRQDANDDRKEIGRKVDELMHLAQSSALATATTTQTMLSHITQCDIDKKAVRDDLAKQNSDLSSRLGKVEQKVWIAMGAVTVLGFFGELLVKVITK